MSQQQVSYVGKAQNVAVDNVAGADPAGALSCQDDVVSPHSKSGFGSRFELQRRHLEACPPRADNAVTFLGQIGLDHCMQDVVDSLSCESSINLRLVDYLQIWPATDHPAAVQNEKLGCDTRGFLVVVADVKGRQVEVGDSPLEVREYPRLQQSVYGCQRLIEEQQPGRCQ